MHKNLPRLFQLLHAQGYEGVECSVRLAAALDKPSGAFTALLNVRSTLHP